MRFIESRIKGVFEVIPVPHTDERGCFARVYCPEEYAKAGICFRSTQINISTNLQKHTLRGLHFQLAPHSEAKLIRCISGKAYDVVVDLRPKSAAFGQWQAFSLSAANMKAVFIPEGCAHGFLTLENNTALQYQMGIPYQSGHANGLCWNDPILAVEWPTEPQVMSDNDRNWPAFSPSDFLISNKQ